MARYSVAAVFLFAALLINGCSSTPPGETGASYAASQDPPPLSTVKKAAKFGLYPANSQTPIWSGELGPGDEYGFVKRADGLIYGVAKGQDIPLPDSANTRYVWSHLDTHSSSDD